MPGITDDLKDVSEPEDDFFEKILNEDIEIPKDDDDDDKKVEKEVDPKDQQKDEESVESLKAKIAELEKERKGQLSDVIKSRQDRQLFKSELGSLKDAVATLLEKRSDTLGKEIEEETKNPLDDPKARVEFGADDKAYVDLSEVKRAIATESAANKATLDEIQYQRAIEESQKTYFRNVQSIISENEEVYTKAYDGLKETYKAFNEKIIELQNRTGEMGDDGVLSQDVAIELFIGSPEEAEFLKEHPGVDPTRIARAFNSKPDLRVGLKHVAKAKNFLASEDKAADGVLDDKIKAARNKPGSLAGQENRTSDTSDLIERIANMSSADFENLSDAETAKIEAMLLNEELKG